MNRAEQQFLTLCREWGGLSPQQKSKIVWLVRKDKFVRTIRAAGGIFLIVLFLILWGMTHLTFFN